MEESDLQKGGHCDGKVSARPPTQKDLNTPLMVRLQQIRAKHQALELKSQRPCTSTNMAQVEQPAEQGKPESTSNTSSSKNPIFEASAQTVTTSIEDFEPMLLQPSIPSVSSCELGQLNMLKKRQRVAQDLSPCEKPLRSDTQMLAESDPAEKMVLQADVLEHTEGHSDDKGRGADTPDAIGEDVPKAPASVDNHILEVTSTEVQGCRDSFTFSIDADIPFTQSPGLSTSPTSLETNSERCTLSLNNNVGDRKMKSKKKQPRGRKRKRGLISPNLCASNDNHGSSVEVSSQCTPDPEDKLDEHVEQQLTTPSETDGPGQMDTGDVEKSPPQCGESAVILFMLKYLRLKIQEGF